MKRFSKEEEIELMKEKGLKNQEELEEWYRKREESIRKIRQGIRRFMYGEEKEKSS